MPPLPLPLPFAAARRRRRRHFSALRAAANQEGGKRQRGVAKSALTNEEKALRTRKIPSVNAERREAVTAGKRRDGNERQPLEPIKKRIGAATANQERLGVGQSR